MKYLLFFSVLIFSITSCNENSENKNVESEYNRSAEKTIQYPYEFIDVKKEYRENDGKYNVMRLYLAKQPVNIDTLLMFCKEQRQNWEDGVINIVVFFDDKRYARFPNNPITALYSDEKDLKHIVADYWNTSFNGYRKLNYYKENNWESPAQEIDLRNE